jgi:hypothetical protein
MTDIEMALDQAFSAVFGRRFRMPEVKPATGGPEDQFTIPTRTERLAPKLTVKTVIKSPEWRAQVKHRLLDGYGSEDIAIWLNCHVSHVTSEIQRLRARGDLAKWFSK